MEYTYTAVERETIIRYSDAEDTAVVESFNEAMKRKLIKLIDEQPEKVKYVDDWETRKRYGGVAVVMPKTWIKIRVPMIISDEQKEIRADRLRQHRINYSTV